MARKSNRKTVELVRNTYQPSKAEMEEEFQVDAPGTNTLDRMAAITRAVTQPVKVRWVDRPRKQVK